MIDEKYMELINKAVSGEITPDEKVKLHRYLQTTPEAEKLYREMLQTADLLSSVGDVEPPPHLKTRIMNSVDFSRYEAREQRPVIGLLSRARHPRLSPRLAYSFALGVVVGLVVFSVFVTRPGERYPTDIRHLYGTIGITEDTSFTSIERLPVSLEDVTGSIDLSRLGDVFVFDVSLRGLEKYDLLLVYDPHQVSFGGLKPHEGGQALLSAGRGYVETSGSGDCDLRLSFVKEKGSAASVDLKLMSSGELLLGHRFAVVPREES
jgi:hypothetical protein